MMVIFLVSLVSLILIRTLVRIQKYINIFFRNSYLQRKDYAKYSRDDEEMDSLDRGIGDDSGWKQIHGDVFRRPEYCEFYAGILYKCFIYLIK